MMESKLVGWVEPAIPIITICVDDGFRRRLNPSYEVHTRPRVPRASGVPHALFGRKIQQSLGRIASRGRRTVFRRHCERSEAIHPFFTRPDGLLRFARNDGTGSANARPMTGSAKQSILLTVAAMDCFARKDVIMRFRPSSPANGSAEWPPDDRLRRAIQYSEA